MTFNNEKYAEIWDFIENNKKEGGKNVKIIAVSKNHTTKSILEAIKFGVRIFGENRVQEASTKFTDIKKDYPDLQLHLTGPLQTNKVKSALKIFDVFHTLDRTKLADEFNKNFDLTKNKKFFIQVNIGNEIQKSGIEPENLNEFIKYCKNKINLNIVGLMCIPPINDEPENYFNNLVNMSKENNLEYLSMGMSSDYKKAIIAGASHIRLGTILFGQRNTNVD